MNTLPPCPNGPDAAPKSKLVSAPQLLDELFQPGSRPSLRWLREQTMKRAIPFFKLGHLVFFDVEMVRASLAEKNLVRHRQSARISPQARVS